MLHFNCIMGNKVSSSAAGSRHAVNGRNVPSWQERHPIEPEMVKCYRLLLNSWGGAGLLAVSHGYLRRVMTSYCNTGVS